MREQFASAFGFVHLGEQLNSRQSFKFFGYFLIAASCVSSLAIEPAMAIDQCKGKGKHQTYWHGKSDGFDVKWTDEDIVCRAPGGGVVFSTQRLTKRVMPSQFHYTESYRKEKCDLYASQRFRIMSLVGPYLSLNCFTSLDCYLKGEPEEAHPGMSGFYFTVDLRHPADLLELHYRVDPKPIPPAITDLVGSQEFLAALKRNPKMQTGKWRMEDLSDLPTFRETLSRNKELDFGEGLLPVSIDFLNNFSFYDVSGGNASIRIGLYAYGASRGGESQELDVSVPVEGELAAWLWQAKKHQQGLLQVDANNIAEEDELPTGSALLFDSAREVVRAPNTKEQAACDKNGVEGLMKCLYDEHKPANRNSKRAKLRKAIS